MSERTPAELLAEASGLTPTAIQDLWQDVKANQARLSGCAGHVFGRVVLKRISDDVSCCKCGGKMTIGDIHSYAKGYAAAGGNPLDVWGVVRG